jgi:hypothetical protein
LHIIGKDGKRNKEYKYQDLFDGAMCDSGNDDAVGKDTV